MKRFFVKLPLLFLVLILLFPPSLHVFAEGDGNIEGGGSDLGNGTAENVWNGLDGVRITVVTSDGTVASTPFDLTNSNIPNNIINFGAVCKLQYTAGTSLTPSSSYSCSKPGTPLPKIVSGNLDKADINAIRRYFCSEYAAHLVADKTGIAFENLIDGSYKLLIEPIAYFTHNKVDYAMTATEAALYNQLGGTLQKKMPSLSHKNLPLALFLEYPDLGYPAWSGSTTEKVTDTQILSSLGIGIVSYRDVPPEMLEAPDYVYRVDTDVITSITLTTVSEINPDNPATATFSINGGTYTVTDIVIPANSSQLVWVKWHTPSAPATIPIKVTVTGAHAVKTEFLAQVVSLDENPPPDPLATDTRPGYTLPSLPSRAVNTTAYWSVWSASWHPDWKWETHIEWESYFVWESDKRWEDQPCNSRCPQYCPGGHGVWRDYGHWEDVGHWVDKGEWVDHGWYVFHSTSYAASLTGVMEIHPDDIVPTKNGDIMRSGYGVKESVTASLSCNAPDTHYTVAQNAISYFPEFSYESYWRMLTPDGAGHLIFKANPYSTYNRNVHFTPVWFPDTSYTIYTYLLDAWTPAGMLSMNLHDNIQIQGNLFDDWYTSRE